MKSVFVCQEININVLLSTQLFFTHHAEGLQQGKVDEINFTLAFVFPSFSFKALSPRENGCLQRLV